MLSDAVITKLHYVLWQNNKLMAAFPHLLPAQRYAEQLSRRTAQPVTISAGQSKATMFRYELGEPIMK